MDTIIYRKEKEIIKMKKIFAITLSASLLLSGCGSSDNTAAGGFMGAQLGSILGSAIGGISGGPRGSDIGTIVGMAGGAMVGAVAGNAADKANKQNDYSYRHRQYDDVPNNAPQSEPATDYDNGDSGFDPNNGGNDIIDDFGTPTQQSPQSPSSIHIQSSPSGISIPSSGNIKALEVRNVKFENPIHPQQLCRGDLAQITVEVFNNSDNYVYNIEPTVTEATGNKHIYVSSPIRVERIAPGKGIRYTAMIKADNRLKEGNARFIVSINENNKKLAQERQEINVKTSK